MFMIREILGYCIISVIGIVCMAVLYAPVCFLLRKRVPPKKQIACFLFGACVIMVLAATVVVGATGTAAADRSLNLVPFRVFQETWDMPQPKKIAQTIANIVMFIPLGIMLPTAFRGMRYFWKTALSLTLFSLAIETAQYFTGRSADIDDLMLNASGGILGYLAFFIISKLVRKNVPANQGGNITIPCENCKKIRRKRVEYRVNKQGNGAFVFGTMSVLRHGHFF